MRELEARCVEQRAWGIGRGARNIGDWQKGETGRWGGF